MLGMSHRRRSELLSAMSVLFLLIGSANCASHAEGTTPVLLQVRFKLTDLDDKPLPGSSVRLVFGSDRDWQGPTAGHRFVTDGNGEHRFETDVTLDKVSRKMPTNFIGSLVSRPQPTDHLMMGAELEYLSFRWLYTLDAYRFPGAGDVLRDGMSIYTRDEGGRFVNKASVTDEGWRVADLGGMLLTAPGHEVWNFMLQPDEADATGRRWTLDLAFKRSPPPSAHTKLLQSLRSRAAMVRGDVSGP